MAVWRGTSRLGLELPKSGDRIPIHGFLRPRIILAFPAGGICRLGESTYWGKTFLNIATCSLFVDTCIHNVFIISSASTYEETTFSNFNRFGMDAFQMLGIKCRCDSCRLDQESLCSFFIMLPCVLLAVLLIQ